MTPQLTPKTNEQIRSELSNLINVASSGNTALCDICANITYSKQVEKLITISDINTKAEDRKNLVEEIIADIKDIEIETADAETCIKNIGLLVLVMALVKKNIKPEDELNNKLKVEIKAWKEQWFCEAVSARLDDANDDATVTDEAYQKCIENIQKDVLKTIEAKMVVLDQEEVEFLINRVNELAQEKIEQHKKYLENHKEYLKRCIKINEVIQNLLIEHEQTYPSSNKCEEFPPTKLKEYNLELKKSIDNIENKIEEMVKNFFGGDSKQTKRLYQDALNAKTEDNSDYKTKIDNLNKIFENNQKIISTYDKLLEFVDKKKKISPEEIEKKSACSNSNVSFLKALSGQVKIDCAVATENQQTQEMTIEKQTAFTVENTIENTRAIEAMKDYSDSQKKHIIYKKFNSKEIAEIDGEFIYINSLCFQFSSLGIAAATVEIVHIVNNQETTWAYSPTDYRTVDQLIIKAGLGNTYGNFHDCEERKKFIGKKSEKIEDSAKCGKAMAYISTDIGYISYKENGKNKTINGMVGKNLSLAQFERISPSYCNLSVENKKRIYAIVNKIISCLLHPENYKKFRISGDALDNIIKYSHYFSKDGINSANLPAGFNMQVDEDLGDKNSDNDKYVLGFDDEVYAAAKKEEESLGIKYRGPIVLKELAASSPESKPDNTKIKNKIKEDKVKEEELKLLNALHKAYNELPPLNKVYGEPPKEKYIEKMLKDIAFNGQNISALMLILNTANGGMKVYALLISLLSLKGKNEDAYNFLKKDIDKLTDLTKLTTINVLEMIDKIKKFDSASKKWFTKFVNQHIENKDNNPTDIIDLYSSFIIFKNKIDELNGFLEKRGVSLKCTLPDDEDLIPDNIGNMHTALDQIYSMLINSCYPDEQIRKLKGLNLAEVQNFYHGFNAVSDMEHNPEHNYSHRFAVNIEAKDSVESMLYDEIYKYELTSKLLINDYEDETGLAKEKLKDQNIIIIKRIYENELCIGIQAIFNHNGNIETKTIEQSSKQSSLYNQLATIKNIAVPCKDHVDLFEGIFKELSIPALEKKSYYPRPESIDDFINGIGGIIATRSNQIKKFVCFIAAKMFREKVQAENIYEFTRLLLLDKSDEAIVNIMPFFEKCGYPLFDDFGNPPSIKPDLIYVNLLLNNDKPPETIFEIFIKTISTYGEYTNNKKTEEKKAAILRCLLCMTISEPQTQIPKAIEILYGKNDDEIKDLAKQLQGLSEKISIGELINENGEEFVECVKNSKLLCLNLTNLTNIKNSTVITDENKLKMMLELIGITNQSACTNLDLVYNFGKKCCAFNQKSLSDVKGEEFSNFIALFNKNTINITGEVNAFLDLFNDVKFISIINYNRAKLLGMILNQGGNKLTQAHINILTIIKKKINDALTDIDLKQVNPLISNIFTLDLDPEKIKDLDPEKIKDLYLEKTNTLIDFLLNKDQPLAPIFLNFINSTESKEKAWSIISDIIELHNGSKKEHKNVFDILFEGLFVNNLPVEDAKTFIQQLGTIKTNNIDIFNIVIQSSLQSKNENQTTYKDLIKKLSAINGENIINKINELYQHPPSPTIDKLVALLDNPPSLDVRGYQSNPDGNRDAEQQFGVSKLDSVIAELSKQKNLSTSFILGLKRDFQLVNAYGNTHFPTDGLTTMSVKDMTQLEIITQLDKYKKITQNEKLSAEERYQAQLKILALLRENMWRTTGDMPNSTQIISILLQLKMPGNIKLEVKTGEGKTIINCLSAAIQHYNGFIVDICTSNNDLAKRDYLEPKTALFWRSLDIKTALISSDSKREDYAAVNYSTPSDLALNKAALGGYGSKEGRPTSTKGIVAVSDESDQALYDPKQSYVYSDGGGAENPHAWAYPLVNEFIRSEEYLKAADEVKKLIKENKVANEKTIKEKCEAIIQKLRDFLSNESEDENKFEKLVESINLFQWLASAENVKNLKENVHFRIETKHPNINDIDQKEYSVIVLLDDENHVIKGASLANGAQQFLTSLVSSKKAAENSDKKMKFIITGETACISSTNAYIEATDYNKLIAISGTQGDKKLREGSDKIYNTISVNLPRHWGDEKIKKNTVFVKYGKNKINKLDKRIKDFISDKQASLLYLTTSDVERCEILRDDLIKKYANNKSVKLLIFADAKYQLFEQGKFSRSLSVEEVEKLLEKKENKILLISSDPKISSKDLKSNTQIVNKSPVPIDSFEEEHITAILNKIGDEPKDKSHLVFVKNSSQREELAMALKEKFGENEKINLLYSSGDVDDDGDMIYYKYVRDEKCFKLQTGKKLEKEGGAAEPNTITIVMAEAARGKNFKSASNKGITDVIVTDFNENSRVLEQKEGRTGRYGAQGNVTNVISPKLVHNTYNKVVQSVVQSKGVDFSNNEAIIKEMTKIYEACDKKIVDGLTITKFEDYAAFYQHCFDLLIDDPTTKDKTSIIQAKKNFIAEAKEVQTKSLLKPTPNFNEYKTEIDKIWDKCRSVYLELDGIKERLDLQKQILDCDFIDEAAKAEYKANINEIDISKAKAQLFYKSILIELDSKFDIDLFFDVFDDTKNSESEELKKLKEKLGKEDPGNYCIYVYRGRNILRIPIIKGNDQSITAMHDKIKGVMLDKGEQEKIKEAIKNPKPKFDDVKTGLKDLAIKRKSNKVKRLFDCEPDHELYIFSCEKTIKKDDVAKITELFDISMKKLLDLINIEGFKFDAKSIFCAIQPYFDLIAIMNKDEEVIHTDPYTKKFEEICKAIKDKLGKVVNGIPDTGTEQYIDNKITPYFSLAKNLRAALCDGKEPNKLYEVPLNSLLEEIANIGSELKELKLKELKLKESELKELKLKESGLKELKLKESELKESELKESELKEDKQIYINKAKSNIYNSYHCFPDNHYTNLTQADQKNVFKVLQNYCADSCNNSNFVASLDDDSDSFICYCKACMEKQVKFFFGTKRNMIDKFTDYCKEVKKQFNDIPQVDKKALPQKIEKFNKEYKYKKKNQKIQRPIVPNAQKPIH